MISITVNNFLEWRTKARLLINNDIEPKQVQWFSQYDEQNHLFTETEFPSLKQSKQTFNVPKEFFLLAKAVSHYRSSEQWALLYQALWRITHGETKLLSIASDSTVKRLLDMRRAIGRDIHKMKAFVRFKMVQQNQEELYLAFYRPSHLILPLAAPFFKRRFASMSWAIITPDASVRWSGGELEYFEGEEDDSWFKIEDKSEDLWLTFYRAIFNPARIKLNAMYNEMPKKYWSTMPETKLISSMLQEAPARVETMLKASHSQLTVKEKD